MLTPRQREILSTFAKHKDSRAIPYMKCEPNDPEIMKLAEAGMVKVKRIHVPFDEFTANYDSPFFSCGIAEPQTGQVG